MGKLILSFALQKPGTARNGKSKIFDPDNYEKIFKVNYEKEASKKGFIIDLIDLNDRYDSIEKKYKIGGLNELQTEVLKNGKQMIFALLGICYRLINGDISKEDLLDSPQSAYNIPFNYGKFTSNYKNDDFERKLEGTIKDIVIILTDIYNSAFNDKRTTSVSNFLKSDQRYYSEILPRFSQSLSFLVGNDLMNCIDILRR